MITIGEMQISGMLTMLMLSVMLMLCVPHRSKRRSSFARARWLMAVGTGLISLQFLLQYIFGFRQMGVTQAVFCNLLLFTPASLLCGMSILYVQRQGIIRRKEWMVACGICAASMLILLGTISLDGIPFRQGSPAMRIAEYVVALLYVVMQTYIFIMQYKAYIQVKMAVREYFDRERHDLFGWMGLSMRVMAMLAFFVPLVIFTEGKALVLFSIAYFFCIAYSTISLYTYGVSENIIRVEEAEEDPLPAPPLGECSQAENDNKVSPKGGDSEGAFISASLESWISDGYYRQHNLTLSVVAKQMKLTRRQLQEWLRQSEYKNLAGLVTQLRIEEAKRVLKEKPEWSVETIADYCGFSSREYFHRSFREYTGMTPAKFQNS
ncbi:MAG: helix-turn-helix transcriptional regulator [Bacteroidaceae bacterium]|nr:helix-turn-helix transcriptional regulator [Bacteroidaceae bacterium]